MPVRVLIVDAQSERMCALSEALRASGFEVLGVIHESEDVYGRVRELKPDAILIDAASPTRDTLEGLAVIGKRFPRPILMLSDAHDTRLVREAVQLGISTYAVDGLSPLLMRSLIEVSMAHFQSQRRLAAELQEAQQALQDRRAIDRAKYLLVENHGLSEDQAYHHLRRMAMERGMRIGELARLLLDRDGATDT
jgi:response regulator NasT